MKHQVRIRDLWLLAFPELVVMGWDPSAPRRGTWYWRRWWRYGYRGLFQLHWWWLRRRGT